ncbi:MAG: phosphatidate cytidylyltransferase [Gammaproteobacteria bacterium]
MLWQRVLTALALLPLILGAIFFLSTPWFAVVMAVAVLVAGNEWGRMAPVNGKAFLLLLTLSMAAVFLAEQVAPGVAPLLFWCATAFWLVALVLVTRYPGLRTWAHRPALMYAIGLLLLLPAWYAVVFLQSTVFHVGGNDVRGLLLLGAFLIVWGADVGAYFAGRAFGRRKLAVHVSPGKSVEGAVGGLALTQLLAFALAMSLGFSAGATALLLLLVLVSTGASILGDLFESLVKREAGVKDSGTLLPGHGGMLDRIDSVTCAMPVFALGYAHLAPYLVAAGH